MGNSWGKFHFDILFGACIYLLVTSCGGSFTTLESANDNKNSEQVHQEQPPPSPQPEPTPPDSSILTYCPFDLTETPNDYLGRKVIRVCPEGDNRPGCDTNSIQAAINTAKNGERIEIVKAAVDYQECAVVPASAEGLEIVGVCGRPHLKNDACQSKGYFLNLGKDITFTHLEISGVSISAGEGGNGAAIRDQGLGGLTVRYCHFHHNQTGILGGSGIVKLEWSKFEANGSPVKVGYTHNIYMGSDVTQLIITNSLFLRARHEGNNLKSRAQSMIFQCSVSASLDGVDSREMDISEGGDVVIKNSLIQQGSSSSNSNLIGFATEATNPDRRHSNQKLSIENTLMINDKGSGSFFQYNAFNSFQLSFKDLITVGSGTIKSNLNGGTESFTEDNSQTFGSRAGAKLPAASNSHFDLPKPPGCADFKYF